jgi:hypothetical protein
MPNCPHCGRDTTAERPAPTGSLEAGAQAYRTRHNGVQLLTPEDTSDNVHVPRDAA